MQIIKEKLDIDETLNKKINNLLKFLNIKSKLINGNIIHISKTNLAYIDLFFNNCENVYINTLEQSISLNELERHIKANKIN